MTTYTIRNRRDIENLLTEVDSKEASIEDSSGTCNGQRQVS